MKEKKSFFIKLWLVLLWLSSVVIASFCSAEIVLEQVTYTVPVWDTNFIPVNQFPWFDFYCFTNVNNCSQLWYNVWTWNQNATTMPTNYNPSLYWQPDAYGFCVDKWTKVGFWRSTTCDIQVTKIKWSLMSSLECQSEYSLIPVSSVDQNYCETNNLCPSCSVCPDWDWSLTDLYINNILHVWAPTILMNIPEEIDWDYAYTSWWNIMNIDVVGYNVDYEKMQETIDIQNYKPSNEDLSNVITNVIPLFVPWLCIILLLYFIFKFIKKIF